MPHTRRSQWPSGSAQLGGLQTFAGTYLDEKVAPIPAAIEPPATHFSGRPARRRPVT